MKSYFCFLIFLYYSGHFKRQGLSFQLGMVFFIGYFLHIFSILKELTIQFIQSNFISEVLSIKVFVYVF